MSSSGVLSTIRSTLSRRVRIHATAAWTHNNEAVARTPFNRDVDAVATAPRIEPIDTVTAKSNDDILENDRSPMSRTAVTTNANIATASSGMYAALVMRVVLMLSGWVQPTGTTGCCGTRRAGRA